MSTAAYYRGRTALVTGASAGIGEAFARELARRGARVVLVARSEGKLRALAAELGGGAVALAADLQRPDAARELAARLAAAELGIDVLVNNAGFGLLGPTAALDPDELEGMVALNCTTLTGLAARLVPAMVARGRGGLLNVASTAAFQPLPGLGAYAATKAYVLSFTRALHEELRGSGVHASCLCPGPVPTGFGERAGMPQAFFRAGLPAATVARVGLDALARNRREAIPGLLNRVGAVGTRFVPTGPLLRAVAAVTRRQS